MIALLWLAMNGHPGPPLRRQSDRADRLRAVCAAEALPDGGALLREEQLAGIRAPRRDGTSADWAALGCARVELAYAGVAPRGGTLMVDGSDWDVGAANAMREAVRRDPTNVRAARALAILTLQLHRPRDLRQIVAALAAARRAGVIAPEVLQGCDELALRIGNDTLARECALDGLARGLDSTWHEIRLAHVDARRGDSVGAMRAFANAAAADRDPDADADMRWQLRWFVTPDEFRAWATVPASDRGHWIGDLLAERDVLDGQPPGSRLVEHFKRLDYVLAHFEMYVPPADEQKVKNGMSGVAFNDLTDPLKTITGGMLISSLGTYRRWQVDLDDRGVVWMRLGPPEKRYGWGYNFARELWVYDIDHLRELLHFQDEDFNGNEEATRLVTGVSDPFFCGIDPLRCEGGAYMSGYSSVPARLQSTITAQDRQSLAIATELDDNSVRGAGDIALAAQLYRYWNPITLAPSALVTYAVPTSIFDTGPGDPAVAPVLTIRTWLALGDRERDTTFRTALPTRRQLVPDGFLVGAIPLSSDDDIAAWSVTARFDSLVGKDADRPESLRTNGPVSLSDLFLGDSAQGLRMGTVTGTIPLAPLGAFARTRPLNLYFQVLSDRDLTDGHTTIALVRLNGFGARDSTVIQLTNDQGPIHRGLTEITRTIDLTRLPAGSYRMVVDLLGAGGGAGVAEAAVGTSRSTSFVLY